VALQAGLYCTFEYSLRHFILVQSRPGEHPSPAWPCWPVAPDPSRCSWPRSLQSGYVQCRRPDWLYDSCHQYKPRHYLVCKLVEHDRSSQGGCELSLQLGQSGVL